ncbi:MULTISPECIES: hypothetical protein [unclassified Pseudoalteromonas]|uniref:hypothetical protein n=1 Tax=unclassified Pseudoalteromonas TaxID=194690 RepID=UPI0016001E8E|nr:MULTISPECIES: hypothetical protein [unclassified Pseudoalteromonas]MBB1333869.1 hypothetical protein [Pseudoalteromonas sp. SR41-6]MBB1459590.1 hypothetical protein [Pseudoalteromonas sp. SG41-8]
MSLVITPNSKQALSIKQQLQLASLPAKKRTKVLKQLGRYERTLARDRIKSQTTVQGRKFASREDGSSKKMLAKLGKTLEPYVKASNRLELKHKNKLTGRIAARHQEGIAEKMTANRMARIHGKPDYDAPATKGQAKALIAEGVKVPKKKGKGFRKPLIKEVQETFTQGRAGAVLSQLRNKTKRNSWQIPVKARPFLGDSSANVQAQLATILNQLNKRG